MKKVLLILQALQIAALYFLDRITPPTKMHMFMVLRNFLVIYEKDSAHAKKGLGK